MPRFTKTQAPRDLPMHRLRSGMSVSLLFAVATLLALASAPGIAQENPTEKQKDRPNVVWVMADDLGSGDLGCYGQKQIKTPHIDAMAAEGLRFTNYYAGSTVCAPSRCVLMTGLHTGHCFIRGNKRVNLRAGDVTVGEVFQVAGYRTGMFGKWGLGQEKTGGIPFVQGFEEFLGYLDQHHAHNYYPAFLIKNRERLPLKNVVPGEGDYGSGVATEKNEYSHDLIFAAALEFIDQHHAAPFFLYLPVTLPHANNEARNKGMEIGDYGQYKDKDWPEPQKGLAAMISRIDSDMELLFIKLREHGLDEKTLVFFTSDNGPHREGGNDPNFFDSNGPLRGIKRDLYEGGIRMPLIARWPGRIAPGSVSDHVAYHGDLMATVAELISGRYPAGLDSVSFAPTLLAQPDRQKQHEYLYWEFHERKFSQAVRMGKWKAVRYLRDNAQLELYDLQQDLGEEHNVAAEHPDLVATLAAVMEQAHVDHPEWPAPPAPAVAEEKKPAGQK